MHFKRIFIKQLTMAATRAAEITGTIADGSNHGMPGVKSQGPDRRRPFNIKAEGDTTESETATFTHQRTGIQVGLHCSGVSASPCK